MDVSMLLISSGVGAGVGLIPYALVKLRQSHRERHPYREGDCLGKHHTAAAELTIYGHIVSPEIAEHVSTCSLWLQEPDVISGWRVVATPVGRIEYICEHAWKADRTCIKCGVKEAEAYRLPSIDRVTGTHKSFRRSA